MGVERMTTKMTFELYVIRESEWVYHSEGRQDNPANTLELPKGS